MKIIWRINIIRYSRKTAAAVVVPVSPPPRPTPTQRSEIGIVADRVRSRLFHPLRSPLAHNNRRTQNNTHTRAHTLLYITRSIVQKYTWSRRYSYNAHWCVYETICLWVLRERYLYVRNIIVLLYWFILTHVCTYMYTYRVIFFNRAHCLFRPPKWLSLDFFKFFFNLLVAKKSMFSITFFLVPS